MIRINLAKRRKDGGALKSNLSKLQLSDLGAFFKGGSAVQITGSDKSFDLKNSAIIKTVLVVVACYLVGDTLDGYRIEAMNEVNKQIQAVETETNTITAKLNKVQGFEPVKAQLEEDEKTIRNKLEVINRLMENRNAPSRTMLQIARSIPEEVWLTDLKVGDGSIVLDGATPGYNQVSDFLKSLTDSSQFTDISLKGIEENMTFAKDQRFQTFQITAKRRN